MTMIYRIKPEEMEQLIDRYFQEMQGTEVIWDYAEDPIDQYGGMSIEIFGDVTIEHPGLPESMTADSLWDDEDLIVDDKGGDDFLSHLTMSYEYFEED